MPKWIFALYARAYHGRVWLEDNKNSSSYEQGEELYESIVEQLNEAGYPEVPWVIAHDNEDRFGWHNKEYVLTLGINDNNEYVALKWEELMIRLDKENKSIDKLHN